MASTRYTQQPLQIYQDPVTSFGHTSTTANPNSSRPLTSLSSPSRQKKPEPLRPIKNAASRRNIVLNPPQQGPSKPSPSKSAHHSSSSPSRAPFGSRLNMITMPPPERPTQQTDSIEKKAPLMSKFKPQKALFTTFPGTKSQDIENQPPQAHPTAYKRTFDESNFSLKGLYDPARPAKRTLLEAAPIQELRPLKKSRTEGQQAEDVQEDAAFTAPDAFPPLYDDGSKPPHSYAQLIGMSILRAPTRRLTLAQIYKWISDTYSFYSPTDAGWQNSIRHNLSLNKAFIKQERPKDDPGKGNYWVIQPGSEHQFIKDKSRKPGPNENMPLLATNLAPLIHMDTSQSFKPLVPAPTLPQPQCSMPAGPLPAIAELSSDATIPASDGFEEVVEEPEELPSSPVIQSSPPVAVMHSSPPVARHVPRRQATPPPVPRFPTSSRTRSHKRKFASMDDSGYFSSLDSSAKRPHHLLTSGAERPKIKRGRAEEEIARLRGSSYDSPSKNRAALAGFGPVSSSPLRRLNNNGPYQVLPPLTPAVQLKAPVRPPMSISPNTNLRLHRDKVREMVGSPNRNLSCLDETLPPWSPNFNLDDVPFIFGNLNNHDSDIFDDTDLDFAWAPLAENGSPEKRSAKRPRLERAMAVNVLADISTNCKSVTSTPMLKFTPNLAPATFDSPTRSVGLMESPIKMFGLDSPSKRPAPFSATGFTLLADDDFYGAEFLSEDAADFSGMDITQGFQKIGARAPASRPAATKATGSTRATLARSFTSQF